MIVVAPALMAVSMARRRNWRSLRVASSADHSTSSRRLRAWVTERAITSMTASGSICSLCFMCRSLVAITT
ncbi:hypothetical protein D3C87_1696480 [compost metagenome]